MEQADGKHPCPVCGKTIFEEDDSYDICEFCGWEDNAYQEDHPYTGGGPNPSLHSCRKNIAKRSLPIPIILGQRSATNKVKRRASFGSSIAKICRTMSRICFAFPSTTPALRVFLTPIPPLNSKNCDNYTHKKTWDRYVPAELRRGKPYNYYPCGRVEIKDREKAKIFLNPDIATDEVIAYIIEKFRLQYRTVKVIADGSRHYGYSAEEER